MKKLSLLTVSALLLGVPSFVHAMPAAHVSRIVAHAATHHVELTAEDKELLGSKEVTTATAGVSLLRSAKSADDVRNGLAQLRAAAGVRGPVAGDAGHAEDDAISGLGRPDPHVRPAPRGKGRPLPADPTDGSVITQDEYKTRYAALEAEYEARKAGIERTAAEITASDPDNAEQRIDDMKKHQRSLLRRETQKLRAAYVRSMPTNTGSSEPAHQPFPVETARQETPGRHIEALDRKLAITGRPPVAAHHDSRQMASKLQQAPGARSKFPADAERTASSPGAWAFLESGVTQAEWTLCMHTDQAQKLSVCFHNKDATGFADLLQTLKAQR